LDGSFKSCLNTYILLTEYIRTYVLNVALPVSYHHTVYEHTG